MRHFYISFICRLERELTTGNSILSTDGMLRLKGAEKHILNKYPKAKDLMIMGIYEGDKKDIESLFK